MNLVKRAFINIKRNLGKFGLLFGLVLLLGSLASGAVSIQRAVQSTEERLIAQIPPVANIVTNDIAWDVAARELGGDRLYILPVTEAMVRKIGALPYVRRFDYDRTAVTLFSTEVIRYVNRFPNPEWNLGPFDMLDWGSLATTTNEVSVIDGLEWFNINGVSDPDMVEIDTELIEITRGRALTQEDIDEEAPVILVSQGFADANFLDIGSTLELDAIVFDSFRGNIYELEGVQETSQLLEDALFQSSLNVEVIGIFEVVTQINADTDGQNFNWTQNMLNQIYGTHGWVEAVNELLDGYRPVVNNEEESTVWSYWINPVFWLYDPRDLEAFSEASAQILPEFWRIDNLASNLDTVLYSMEMMNWIADLILYTAVGATVVIVGLLIILFLRDRSQEVGLYLALGERKGKVLGQLWVEVFVISIVALNLSLVVGNFLSDGLSRVMLQNDLLQQEEEMPWIIETTMPELAWHNPGEVTIEEMLELYDTSLDSETVLLFLGIASLTITASTLAPMGYVLKLNPKQILM